MNYEYFFKKDRYFRARERAKPSADELFFVTLR